MNAFEGQPVSRVEGPKKVNWPGDDGPTPAMSGAKQWIDQGDRSG